MKNDLSKNFKLKPAKNIRRINRRCCATCYEWDSGEGFGHCLRIDGFECDVSEAEQWQHVCDRWRDHG